MDNVVFIEKFEAEKLRLRRNGSIKTKDNKTLVLSGVEDAKEGKMLKLSYGDHDFGVHFALGACKQNTVSLYGGKLGALFAPLNFTEEQQEGMERLYQRVVKLVYENQAALFDVDPGSISYEVIEDNFSRPEKEATEKYGFAFKAKFGTKGARGETGGAKLTEDQLPTLKMSGMDKNHPLIFDEQGKKSLDPTAEDFCNVMGGGSVSRILVKIPYVHCDLKKVGKSVIPVTSFPLQVTGMKVEEFVQKTSGAGEEEGGVGAMDW
jgi:hypothetical protein